MHRKSLAIILAAVFLCGVLPFAAFAQTPVNLAAGLEYTIATGEPITASYGEQNIVGTQLTDGEIAPLSQDSPLWYKAYSGQSRIAGFDLGAICAVSSVEAGFLHSKESKIYAPRYINVYLSENGSDYQLVCNQTAYEIYKSTEVNRYDAVIAFDKTYAARYVRVEYCTDFHTYCDEIKIMGAKALSGNEAEVKPDTPKDKSGYLGAVAGAWDIVKLYNGYYPQDPSIGVLTEAEILPYIAYIDANGEIAGKMFDAIAVLPCDVAYPSGGKLNKSEGFSGALQSDWELYFENTFTPGQDIDAIDKAAGKVNAALNAEGKFKVFLAIPYPAVINKYFGDIDGDGNGDYCRTLDDRIAIIKWYINKCITVFAEENYDNITLAGFCWINGIINYTDSDHEDLLVQTMNDYVHDLNLATVFTPDYLASGFDCWADLGFDAACMQTNLAENGFSAEMLMEYAASIYGNHLGAQAEACDPREFTNDEESNYLQCGYYYESHLYYGSISGYMNGLNIYEQGIGPGSFYDFCYADISTPRGIYLRRLYDLTYRYINGNYNNVPPTVTVEDDIEIVYGDSQITLALGINDIDSHWENISVEFPVLPAHGMVTAAANKQTLIYNVDEEYVGGDSFTLCISDGFNKSEEITVNITVSKPAVPEVSQDVSVAITPPPSNPQTSIPLWLIIILAILASAMVIVAVVTIVKPKKNEE